MRAGLFSPFLFRPGQGQVKINYNQLLRLLCIWWRLKGVVWRRTGLAEVQFYLFHYLPLRLEIIILFVLLYVPLATCCNEEVARVSFLYINILKRGAYIINIIWMVVTWGTV